MKGRPITKIIAVKQLNKSLKKADERIPAFRDITTDPMSPEEKALREPLENWVFAASLVVNILLIVLAVLAVIYGTEWATSYPYIANHSTKIRPVAIAILSGPILVTFLRYTRYAYVMGQSIELSEDQVPFLYDIYKPQCEKLGILKMPKLYLSEKAIPDLSHSFSTWSKDYTVLATDVLDAKVENSREAAAFLLGSELGRLRLGHTTWVDELLLSYISKIPYLRNPIHHIRIYSRDRYGAYLAPDGILGLVIQASGRRQLRLVNSEDYLKHVKNYGNLWSRLAMLQKNDPPVAWRIKRLLDAGLFDIDTVKNAASGKSS